MYPVEDSVAALDHNESLERPRRGLASLKPIIMLQYCHNLWRCLRVQRMAASFT